MRLFLDANVLFTAAHNPEGKAAFVIELGQAGIWQLATSAYALEEARRNITRKYPDSASRLDGLVEGLAIVADSASIPCPEGLAARDCPIYRAARACKADVLLTGDIRDFGFLMNDTSRADGLLIQTVADFLAGI
jgi:predicted nucleic acid-binding protein